MLNYCNVCLARKIDANINLVNCNHKYICKTCFETIYGNPENLRQQCVDPHCLKVIGDTIYYSEGAKKIRNNLENNHCAHCQFSISPGETFRFCEGNSATKKCAFCKNCYYNFDIKELMIRSCVCYIKSESLSPFKTPPSMRRKRLTTPNDDEQNQRTDPELNQELSDDQSRESNDVQNLEPNDDQNQEPNDESNQEPNEESEPGEEPDQNEVLDEEPLQIGESNEELFQNRQSNAELLQNQESNEQSDQNIDPNFPDDESTISENVTNHLDDGSNYSQSLASMKYILNEHMNKVTKMMDQKLKHHGFTNNFCNQNTNHNKHTRTSSIEIQSGLDLRKLKKRSIDNEAITKKSDTQSVSISNLLHEANQDESLHEGSVSDFDDLIQNQAMKHKQIQSPENDIQSNVEIDPRKKKLFFNLAKSKPSKSLSTTIEISSSPEETSPFILLSQSRRKRKLIDNKKRKHPKKRIRTGFEFRKLIRKF